MSINNCQAIQKSCIDRKSYAWFHSASAIRCVKMTGSRVTVFKSLNDRQSEFRESSEPIMYMIILQYVNWEVSSDPKIFFSIMSIRISRIAVRSWHQSHDILPIKRDACSWREIFSTRKCGSLLSSGFTQWRSTLASCLTIRCSFYPFCLKICGFVLLIRHIIAWIWPVRFPKFVKTIVLLWKLSTVAVEPKNAIGSSGSVLRFQTRTTGHLVIWKLSKNF